MSESTKKRSRKSKLVPRMYVDLATSTKNAEMQPPSTVSTSREPKDSSEAAESMPAIPFTVKVEVESGDDDDDWWKELEEQAQKEKEAQNETQPGENVTAESVPLDGDGNLLHRKDDNTDELELEDWNCKNNILGEHTDKICEKITVKSEERLFEKAIDKFAILQCDKTDFRTSLDDRNCETKVQPEKIPGKSKALQLKLAAKRSLISKPASSKKTLKRVSNVLSVTKKVKLLLELHSNSSTTKSVMELQSPAQYYTKSVNETLKKLHASTIQNESAVWTEIVIQSYKCCECKFCWEHYFDFKAHLDIVHNEIMLSIGVEIVKNPFVNIIAAILKTKRSTIAFQDDFQMLSEGMVIFKCVKCKTVFSSAADLESHKKSLLTCVCEKTNPCFEMIRHQANCNVYLKFDLNKDCQCGCNSKKNKLDKYYPTSNCLLKKGNIIYQCPVCFQRYSSSQTLLDHQTAFHTVRSDEFNLQFPTICELCCEVYVGNKVTHYCPKLADESSCKLCGKQFQNDLFLSVHLKAYKPNIPCETCGEVHTRSCQQEQHNALLHDSGLHVLYKCNVCGQLFMNEFHLSKHVLSHEEQKAKYAWSWVTLPEDKIKINYPYCKIVNTSHTDAEEIPANWSDLPRNVIESYYTKEIEKHLDILAIAIRHKVLRDTKITYECKPCKASWIDITDFKSHFADHQGIKMTVTADYFLSPKIIAQTAQLSTQKTIYQVVMQSLQNFSDRKIISYKCYLCFVCWEHYTGFQEHLKEHTKESAEELYITSEILKTFVSIVVWPNSRAKFIEDLPILDETGMGEVFKCLKCKETYLTRVDLYKHKGMTFVCAGCQFTGSCFEVKAHEGSCRYYFNSLEDITCKCGETCTGKENILNHRERCNGKEVVFKCQVCSAQYPKKDILTKHQVEWHNVRSDEFVLNTLHKCQFCSEVCPTNKLKYHHCSKQKDKIICEWCKRQFQNKYFLAVHAKAYKISSDISCEKCGMALGSECLRDEHEVLFHERGDRCILLFKCNICTDMFVNEKTALKHIPFAHSEEERAKYFYHYKKIIVPRQEIVVIRDSFAVYRCNENDRNFDKFLVQVTNSNDNVDYEVSITQTIVAKPGISVTTEDNYETPVVAKEKIDDLDITESAPDLLDDTSEPDEFRLVIKEEVFDEPMEEAFEASENSMDFEIYEEVVVKQEVKSEPTDFKETIVMNEYQNEKQEAEETIDQFIENHTEITMMEIEPELLLNGKGIQLKEPEKPCKIYTCKRCKFSGIHSMYREHKAECTKAKKKRSPSSRYENLVRIICSKCKKDYDDLVEYLNHLKYHNIPKNVCPECKVDLQYPIKLKSHVIRHVKTNFIKMFIIDDVNTQSKTLKIFRCFQCKAVVEEESFFNHWESHLNLDNMKVITYATETKTQTESSHVSEFQDDSNSNSELILDPESRQCLIDALVDSTKKGKPEGKTCPSCNRTFARMNDAKRHLVEHLFDDARATKVANNGLKCPICPEIYRSKDVFKKHMRDHGCLPMYQCHLCDKTFSDSSNFAKHKKVHGLRVLVCDICSRKFQSKKQLEVHIIDHMRKPPLRCEKCDLDFFYTSLYNKHVKRHHGPNGIAPNTVRCGMCHRRFPSLRLKWDHEWQVHQERRTKADCPMCTEKFRKFSDVKHHIRVAHSIGVSKSSYKFCKLLDTINKYNVPVEVVEELLQKKTLDSGSGSSS